MASDRLLALHGTAAFRLPPSAIVGTARRDLVVRARNAEADPGAWEPFAFHREHVREARSARHLLELALADRERGLASSKVQTLLLYANPDWLEAALEALPE